jgi:glyoxylase-like metal-dependent hydrolase (beta-lactamase superfamily II)
MTALAPAIAATLDHLGAQVLVRGWLSANNIVFHHGGQGQVVDTGYISHADQTLALVDRALAGRPLAEVVNTHLHSDHCGGNAALAPAGRIAIAAASARQAAALGRPRSATGNQRAHRWPHTS